MDGIESRGVGGNEMDELEGMWIVEGVISPISGGKHREEFSPVAKFGCTVWAVLFIWIVGNLLGGG